MPIEDDLADFLQNKIYRLNKILVEEQILKEKLILCMNRRSEMEKKLNTLLQNQEDLQSEVDEINEDITQNQKLLSKHSQDLNSLTEVYRNTEKQIKKLQNALASLHDIDPTQNDLNILAKKQYKLLFIKRSLKLCFDNNPPKNICRGFTTNLERHELSPFEISTTDAEGKTTDLIWKEIEKSATHLDEWRRLFNLK